MKPHTFLTAILAVAINLTPSAAQTFDPRRYQPDVLGEPTRIMVLGTAHLSGTPEDWDANALSALLDRLTAFAPDVIATEDQPGPTITKLWTYREIYPEAAATYGGRALRMATTAGLALDMDMPQAAAAAKALMLTWPEDPSPADRRRLAATFAAAGDPNSALVQWLRLTRRSGRRAMASRERWPTRWMRLQAVGTRR